MASNHSINFITNDCVEISTDVLSNGSWAGQIIATMRGDSVNVELTHEASDVLSGLSLNWQKDETCYIARIVRHLVNLDDADSFYYDFWRKIDLLDTLNNLIMPMVDDFNNYPAYPNAITQYNCDILSALHTESLSWGKLTIKEGTDLWMRLFDGDVLSSKINERMSNRNHLVSKWHTLSKKDGYIYIIKGLFKNPTYKIDYSKEPKTRIRKFNVVLPFPIEVKHLIPTDHMRAVEAYLHDKYSSNRVNGEWFELSEQDVADICAIEVMNAEDLQ